LLSNNLKDESILNPKDVIKHIASLKGLKEIKVPKYCILCFFKEMYDEIKRNINQK